MKSTPTPPDSLFMSRRNGAEIAYTGMTGTVGAPPFASGGTNAANATHAHEAAHRVRERVGVKCCQTPRDRHFPYGDPEAVSGRLTKQTNPRPILTYNYK